MPTNIITCENNSVNPPQYVATRDEVNQVPLTLTTSLSAAFQYRHLVVAQDDATYLNGNSLGGGSTSWTVGSHPHP